MSFVAVLVSYLIGSLSFGYLLGKLGRGIDVRQYGSGSVGSTNILRTLGPLPAALVFLLDLAKGLVAVLLGNWLTGSPTVAMACGLAAVLGHNWPIWFGLRGGRGIATSLGILLAFNPTVFLILLAYGIAIIFIFRYVSLASVTGSALVPPALWVFRRFAVLEINRNILLLAVVLALLAIVRHKDNIGRLLKGTERKIGERIRH
jgi:acyl phosphate:glycerol-3-phosphate acyltransferase